MATSARFARAELIISVRMGLIASAAARGCKLDSTGDYGVLPQFFRSSSGGAPATGADLGGV